MIKKIVLLLVFLVGAGQLTSAKVSRAEKKALIDLYESTNGLHWVKKWDLDKDIEEALVVLVQPSNVRDPMLAHGDALHLQAKC